MWSNVEAKLRQDKKMNNILDVYNGILKSHLKDEDFKPIGTLGRREQISALIVSEYESIHNASESVNKIPETESILSLASALSLNRELEEYLHERNLISIDFENELGVGSYGRTPLSWAAESGHVTMVKRLLEAKVNIELKDGEWGQPPLSWAAWEGNVVIVKLLLEANANIESQDNEWGQTP